MPDLPQTATYLAGIIPVASDYYASRLQRLSAIDTASRTPQNGSFDSTNCITDQATCTEKGVYHIASLRGLHESSNPGFNNHKQSYNKSVQVTCHCSIQHNSPTNLGFNNHRVSVQVTCPCSIQHNSSTNPWFNNHRVSVQVTCPCSIQHNSPTNPRFNNHRVSVQVTS